MVGKAYGEQGQAAQGWGLGEALLGLHCSPCPSLFTMCPRVELWGLNKLLCSEALTTPLLP